MRVKGISFEQLLLAAMLLAALCWNLANASEIKHLRVDAGATGTRAEVLLDREGAYKLIELRNPDRLVVDFPGSHLGRGLSLPGAAGVVKAVRSGQPGGGVAQRAAFDQRGRQHQPVQAADSCGALRDSSFSTIFIMTDGVVSA